MLSILKMTVWEDMEGKFFDGFDPRGVNVREVQADRFLTTANVVITSPTSPRAKKVRKEWTMYVYKPGKEEPIEKVTFPNGMDANQVIQHGREAILRNFPKARRAKFYILMALNS